MTQYCHLREYHLRLLVKRKDHTHVRYDYPPWLNPTTLILLLTSFLSKLRSQLILQKFNIKFFFLHLSFSQIRPNPTEFSIYDVWNGSTFPNYGNQKTSTPVAKRDGEKTFLYSDARHISDRYHTGLFSIYSFYASLLLASQWLLNGFRRSIGEGAIYLRGLTLLFFFDALLTDDEPIWEPIEWSLVQSWILFIFAFAWIAENLITSRYGSYTGRDKRVWVAWYKTFWLIEWWYIMSLGATALFVITPFYHEVSYALPLVVSWWNWYSRVFFFKFIATYSLILYISYYLQLQLTTNHWRKSLLLVIIITIFLSYLLYIHFMMSFFAYFTDPSWYSQTRLVDYVQLSHEPNKWSWGNSKRDHFSYHKSTTVFWFKNDGPFAAAFLLFHIMFCLCLFALYIYWLTLLRRVYATKEITHTYTTYCVSALRQFFYFFFFILALSGFSLVVQYWRLPIEYFWLANTSPLLDTLITEILSYHKLVLSLLGL